MASEEGTQCSGYPQPSRAEPGIRFEDQETDYNKGTPPGCHPDVRGKKELQNGEETHTQKKKKKKALGCQENKQRLLAYLSKSHMLEQTKQLNNYVLF